MAADPGRRSGLDWCFEPAEQLDPDIATNPSLSPPFLGEHAWQTVASVRCPRGRVASGGDHGDDLLPAVPDSTSTR